jgi:5-hydroxyisourate hydrolase-like protein (transthyretin family)
MTSGFSPSPFQLLRFVRFVLATALLAALSWTSLVAQQAPDPSPGTGVITGRVLGNDGSPLVNARVTATEVEPRAPNSVSRTVTTDDEGNFRLTKLQSGAYRISANADGYLSASAGATENSTRPDDQYFRPGATATITLQKGGVITGRVSNAEGQPIVAVPLSLEYVRDNYDRPMSATAVEGEGRTDDRGVYRFYGLRPGSYLVRAGGRVRDSRAATAFDSDAPTYHPSTTRESATEVRVRANEEATGVDIRYRGERGYAIRGFISDAAGFKQQPYLRLIRLPAAQVGFTYARVEGKSLKFEFEGLLDGEYELVAQTHGAGEEENGAASLPRRVTIKGADVHGIEMRLIPRGSLSGRLVLDETPGICQGPQPRRPPMRLMNASLIPHRDGDEHPALEQVRPNQQGEFALREMETGRYRFTVWLPNLEWYLRAVTVTGSTPTRPSSASAVDVSRDGFMLRPGDRASGLTVTLSEGAAFLSGVIVSATEGGPLPERLRIYLIPAEDDSETAVLRYAETDSEAGRRFAMQNLAPGHYWLLARASPGQGSAEQPPHPTAWDAENRSRLWREAKAAKIEVELKPCQRVMDQVLRYEPR